MPAPVIVLTPNLCGQDGISRLARLVTETFDEVTVLALHEPRSMTRFGGARLCTARTDAPRRSSPPRSAAPCAPIDRPT